MKTSTITVATPHVINAVAQISQHALSWYRGCFLLLLQHICSLFFWRHLCDYSRRVYHKSFFHFLTAWAVSRAPQGAEHFVLLSPVFAVLSWYFYTLEACFSVQSHKISSCISNICLVMCCRAPNQQTTRCYSKSCSLKLQHPSVVKLNHQQTFWVIILRESPQILWFQLLWNVNIFRFLLFLRDSKLNISWVVDETFWGCQRSTFFTKFCHFMDQTTKQLIEKTVHRLINDFPQINKNTNTLCWNKIHFMICSWYHCGRY